MLESQKVPMEELKSFQANPPNSTHVLRIKMDLPHSFLLKNIDVFACKHDDMVGIDLGVVCHYLNVNSSHTSHR